MAGQQAGAAVTAIRGGAVTLAEAADAFLSSPRAASPNTRRPYAGVLDRLAAELGPGRQLAAVPGDEIATRALPRGRVERLLSRRDVPLREKTLWRMLYETAARASEILALSAEDLDLEQGRAAVRSKGGDTEFVYWDTGTAHLLPRLLGLPDGTSRASGPLFLAVRRPVPAPARTP